MSRSTKANDYPSKDRPERRKRECWPLWVDGADLTGPEAKEKPGEDSKAS